MNLADDVEFTQRALAWDNPAFLAKSIDRAFQLRAHTLHIGEALARLGSDYDRLLITTPPRAGKSELAAIHLPVWWMANHPRHRVVIAAYGKDLALTHSVAARRIVREHGARWNLTMAEGSTTKADWWTTTGGGLRATGVGGGLTGHGADLLICDDPHKDRAEADSLRLRDAVWDWWSSTALSRLSPGAPVCLIQTRWHPDDLAGRVLKRQGRTEDGGRWKVIHLPAFADHALTGGADPLGRAPGVPLPHPKLPDDTDQLRAYWADRRSESTPRDWGALYMGNPKPREGALVTDELMERQTHPGGSPGVVRAAVAIDPSGGGRDTCGIVGGHMATDGRLWWTHDLTAVMPTEKWARLVCELVAEIDADRVVYEKNYGGDQVRAVIKTSWAALRSSWSLADGDNPYDRPEPYLHGVVSRKSKVLRAEPIAQALAEDRIRLGAYMPELVDEWCGFMPGSPDSPGRIDASVHMAWDLLKAPRSGRAMGSAVGVSTSQVPGVVGPVRLGLY